MARSLRVLVALSLLGAGCEYGLVAGDSGSVPFTLQDPVDVCPGCILGECIEAMAWTGRRYGLIFRQRTSDGTLIHALRLIDPSGQVSASIFLGEADENECRGADLVWDGAQLIALWRNNGTRGVRVRAIGEDGALGPRRTILPDVGVGDVLATATKDGLALTAFSDHKPGFVHLSAYPDLKPSPSVPFCWPDMMEPSGSSWRPVALPGGGFCVAFNLSAIHHENRKAIYVARLDDGGHPLEEPLLIHDGYFVLGGDIVVSEDGRLWVSCDDHDQGLFLADIDLGTWSVRTHAYLHHRGRQPSLLSLGPGSVAVLQLIWSSGLSRPTLLFEAFDLATGDQTAGLTVDDRLHGDVSSMMVRSGNSIGIAWQQGDASTVSRILFSRVTWAE